MTPPNIILIMTDQQRADHLGVMGHPVLQTPHLDALARTGAVFCDHITPHQICAPSRASLFSGRYARHHGLVSNGIALDEDIPLVSADLSAAGYRTHGVGKFHFQPILAAAEHRFPDSEAFWSLPESEGWTGPFYGFETVDSLIGESVAAAKAGHYARWLAETAPGADRLYRPDYAIKPPPDDCDEVWASALPDQLHYNSWITAQACSALRRQQKDQPFFLFVSYPDPHHPFAPPAPWCDLYDPADMPPPHHRRGELDDMPGYILDTDRQEAASSYVEFLNNPGPPREQGFMQTTQRMSEDTLRLIKAYTCGMVSMIDTGIGQLRAQLAQLGLTENTIIIFTSDHGELLGDHGLIRKGPSPYLALLKVPLIITGPGIVAGMRTGLTSHLDLRATCRALAGLDEVPTDGQSLLPMLADLTRTGRKRLFAEFHPRVRKDTYNQTILTDRWRLTCYPEQAAWGELFDLDADPYELNNLYHRPEYKAVKDELNAQLNTDFPPAAQAGGPLLATY